MTPDPDVLERAEDAAVRSGRPIPKPTADVAVIIPAFNNGAHIGQALASVTGQTLQPSAVVVVDDCSSDDTMDRVRDWQLRLPLEVIRLTHNRGPGFARRSAIAATTAAFLAMLDADDLYLPDHLETMVATYAAAPGLISARELSWNPGFSLTMPKGDRRQRKERTDLWALLRHNFINFGFFPRELYELAGGFSDRYYCEDWELWIRMAKSGARITLASHPTAIHRVHSQSLTADSVRTAQHGIALLHTVLQDAPSPREASAARAGLAALNGKLSFYSAIEFADRGNLRQARRAARRGLPGGGTRAAAGLLAVAVAPAAAARLEQMTRQRRLPPGASGPAVGRNSPRRG